jgi:hypothetical protein
MVVPSACIASDWTKRLYMSTFDNDSHLMIYAILRTQSQVQWYLCICKQCDQNYFNFVSLRKHLKNALWHFNLYQAIKRTQSAVQSREATCEMWHQHLDLERHKYDPRLPSHPYWLLIVSQKSAAPLLILVSSHVHFEWSLSLLSHSSTKPTKTREVHDILEYVARLVPTLNNLQSLLKRVSVFLNA